MRYSLPNDKVSAAAGEHQRQRVGEIIMLLRRIVPRPMSAHEGGWDKSASDSHEVRGKVLGIIGYGNIGSQQSV